MIDPADALSPWDTKQDWTPYRIKLLISIMISKTFTYVHTMKNECEEVHDIAFWETAESCPIATSQNL